MTDVYFFQQLIKIKKYNNFNNVGNIIFSLLTGEGRSFVFDGASVAATAATVVDFLLVVAMFILDVGKQSFFALVR